VVALVVGLIIGYYVTQNTFQRKFTDSELALREAERQRDLSAKDLEAERKQTQLKVAEEVLRIRAEIEQDQKEARIALSRQEHRLTQKDETLDRKLDGVERRERALNEQEQTLQTKSAQAEALVQQRLARASIRFST
jgi:ribonuclease Y